MEMNTTNATTNAPAFNSLHTKLQEANLELGKWYAYDAKLGTPEIEGTRAVKCLYKAPSDGSAPKHSNTYTLIPDHITEELVTERVAELAPYIVGWLQGIEDTSVKAQHKAHASQVFTEYLTLDKIIESLEESESGNRLNAEKIGKWFDAEIADMLILQFAEKLGVTSNPTDEQSARISTAIAAYKKKYESLASGKTHIKEADCKAMTTAIELAGASETMLGKRFIARLAKMGEKQEELLLAL